MLSSAVRSNWLAPVGPDLTAFEAEIASSTGTTGAVAVSSGTAAIHLALTAIGVERDDVVVAPSFTFIGSIGPAIHMGAEPWFVDSEWESWNLDPNSLREALAKAQTTGRHVGAVVAVDLFGQCADYSRIESICEEFRVPLIEDAAEALGASHGTRFAGSFGRVGILSFNGNKIVTTSGGGALVSNDTELIERCRFLSTQAREPVVHYEHSTVGFNYRLSNPLAALGRAQLATLDHRVRSRRWIFDRYAEFLGLHDGISFMPESPSGASNRWLTTLTVDREAFGASSLQIVAHLESMDIEARPVWMPMHLQPAFRDATMFGGGIAEALYSDGLCLPSGTGMTINDIRRVADAVVDARVT